MILSRLILAGTIFFATPFAFADGEPEPGQVSLDFPVIDAPFNFTGKGYLFPSMRQSLAMSTDFYESVHRALTGPPESPRWRHWLVLAPDILGSWLPLGSAWMHEEWHRAVMNRRGIASYNDIMDFPLGRGLISVSHETDADLIRLKAEHPHEQVRLAEAGMESQTEQNLLFAKHHFFADSQNFDRVAMLVNTFGNIFYLSECSSHSADSATDDQNSADGSNISKRDFIGLDCTGWAYDLFRPNEPYTARGVHPSGVGVNRYVRYSDLNDNERSFLRRNFMLSFLNLADPFLLGFDRFHATIFGRDIQWNARLSHFLTSFGYTVDANLFLRWDEKKFLLKLHNGFNAETYFPGLTLEWIDQPLTDRLYLNHSLTVWSQPRGQDVHAVTYDTMVSAMERVSYKMDRIKPYVGLEAKTPGWEAGNVYLDRNFTIWTGAEITAF